MQGRFPLGSCVDTSPHTGFEINTRPQVRQEGGLPGTALPRDARLVHGDRGFDDFLLFGVTTEEIRWLQSGVVVPRVTSPPRGGAGTFVGRDANVVRDTAVATPWLSCLRARRPVTFVDIRRLWAPA